MLFVIVGRPSEVMSAWVTAMVVRRFLPLGRLVVDLEPPAGLNNQFSHMTAICQPADLLR